MPNKAGRRTGREAAFIAATEVFADLNQAARAAGYVNPASAANQLMKRPEIVAAVQAQQIERLNNEVLPIAVEEHLKMLRSPKTPAGAKVAAIKLAYDRTLGDSSTGEKQPHEMTADELTRAINELERVASDRAVRVIEHRPRAGVFD